MKIKPKKMLAGGFLLGSKTIKISNESNWQRQR
jgi:hypothetical protein